MPDLRVIDNPISEYRLRACGYTLEPSGIQAALTLLRKKHPNGFTRSDLAEILYLANIPKTKPKGTYESVKDGKQKEYPDNPANALAGRILDRMKDRGVLKYEAKKWYFSGSEPGKVPRKFL